MGRRPAHRRGEAARERQRGDRPACRRAENAPERREGRIVERGRDRDAEQHPDREIGRGMLGIDERDKSERAEERAERHDAMAAVAVDQAPDPRRDQSRGQQRQRKSAHREGERQAALGRDQRHRQHRRIEDRAPGQDLRDAEHQDGAPGPGDDSAKRGHAEDVDRNPTRSRCSPPWRASSRSPTGSPPARASRRAWSRAGRRPCSRACP